MGVVNEAEGIYGVSTHGIDVALSVNIEREFSCLFSSSAKVMAASFARFMVCLSGCYFISKCVVK